MSTMSTISYLGVAEKEIAVLAYAKFEQRGSIHGFDIQDWLEAEKELNELFVEAKIPGITAFIVGNQAGE